MRACDEFAARYPYCTVARFRADNSTIAVRTNPETKTRGAEQPDVKRLNDAVVVPATDRATRPVKLRVKFHHTDDVTAATACGRQIIATTGVRR